MYTKRALSQYQCQAAIASVIAEFKRRPNSPPWTIAIVDDAGNLLAFTRSDGAGLMLGRNCIKKAYTSAMTGSSTKVFGETRSGESDFAANLMETLLVGLRRGGSEPPVLAAGARCLGCARRPRKEGFSPNGNRQCTSDGTSPRKGSVLR